MGDKLLLPYNLAPSSATANLSLQLCTLAFIVLPAVAALTRFLCAGSVVALLMTFFYIYRKDCKHVNYIRGFLEYDDCEEISETKLKQRIPRFFSRYSLIRYNGNSMMLTTVHP